MFKDVTRAHVLTTISIVLSIIVMLFGNNFYEKWQKAELYYIQKEVKLEYPKKMIALLPAASRDSIYGFYQQIQIMNLKKKSATNLKLFINPNGEVKNFKVYSIEDTLGAKIENGVMKIKVDRLVKDADITCNLWFKTKPGSLSIQYIDDNGFSTVKEASQFDNTNYFGVVGLITLSLTVLWFLYNYFLVPLFQNRKELLLQNIDLQQKYDSVNDELEQLKSPKNEIETDDLSDFLNKFIARNRKVGDK